MIDTVHLVMLFGPSAVGKMAVGRELSTLTGYRLFHNHMSIEPVLDVFPWGSPSFVRLTSELRQRGQVQVPRRSEAFSPAAGPRAKGAQSYRQLAEESAAEGCEEVVVAEAGGSAGAHQEVGGGFDLLMLGHTGRGGGAVETRLGDDRAGSAA